MDDPFPDGRVFRRVPSEFHSLSADDVSWNGDRLDPEGNGKHGLSDDLSFC